MPRVLSKFSIYTIAHGDKLAAAAKSTEPSKFSEARYWVTGHRLLQMTRSANEAMPVIFADATDCGRLVYWGILADIKPGKLGMHYFVRGLRRLRGHHAPQELVLRSTGKTIAPNFIRPYAICRTPAFLNAKGSK